jgi:hypothetical protein
VARELAANQHELVPVDESDGLLFGTLDTLYLTDEHPTIEDDDASTNDVARVRTDGDALGTDYAGGSTASFTIHVLTDGEADPHVAGGAALSRHKSWWRDPQFRNRPEARAILRSHMVPGQVRRAYGRPRRWAEATSGTTKQGWSTLICEFYNPEGVWFDDQPSTLSMTTIPSREGGLVTPLVTPLVTATNEVNSQQMIVGGEETTYPVIRFVGPLTNPIAKIGAQITVAVNGTIAEGTTLVYDPRPWRRRVIREFDGASLAGMILTTSTPLRDCGLRPGNYAVSLTGVDLTGTGQLTVEWRNAYSRW